MREKVVQKLSQNGCTNIISLLLDSRHQIQDSSLNYMCKKLWTMSLLLHYLGVFGRFPLKTRVRYSWWLVKIKYWCLPFLFFMPFSSSYLPPKPKNNAHSTYRQSRLSYIINMDQFVTKIFKQRILKVAASSLINLWRNDIVHIL